MWAPEMNSDLQFGRSPKDLHLLGQLMSPSPSPSSFLTDPHSLWPQLPDVGEEGNQDLSGQAPAGAGPTSLKSS